MAPEIMLQMPYGCAVDVWSLGVVLLELVVGKKRLRAVGFLSLMRADEGTAAIERLWHSTPGKLARNAALRDLVFKMLDYNSRTRPTATALLEQHPFVTG